MFKIGVFAIILNKSNEVLLCHRTDFDLWNLPGGGLEKGEAPWEGVIREVKEETGLNVRIEKITGIYSKPNKDEIVVQFLCKVINGKIQLNKEANQIEYFDLDNIPDNTVPKQVERIKDYLNCPNEINLKKQTGESVIEILRKL